MKLKNGWNKVKKEIIEIIESNLLKVNENLINIQKNQENKLSSKISSSDLI
jgi:hypothetical protein